MKKVSGPKVVTTVEALESPLPAEIQEALGELVGVSGRSRASRRPLRRRSNRRGGSRGLAKAAGWFSHLRSRPR